MTPMLDLSRPPYRDYVELLEALLLEAEDQGPEQPAPRQDEASPSVDEVWAPLQDVVGQLGVQELDLVELIGRRAVELDHGRAAVGPGEVDGHEVDARSQRVGDELCEPDRLVDLGGLTRERDERSDGVLGAQARLQNRRGNQAWCQRRVGVTVPAQREAP